MHDGLAKAPMGRQARVIAKRIARASFTMAEIARAAGLMLEQFKGPSLNDLSLESAHSVPAANRTGSSSDRGKTLDHQPIASADARVEGHGRELRVRVSAPVLSRSPFRRKVGAIVPPRWRCS